MTGLVYTRCNSVNGDSKILPTKMGCFEEEMN